MPVHQSAAAWTYRGASQRVGERVQRLPFGLEDPGSCEAVQKGRSHGLLVASGALVLHAELVEFLDTPRVIARREEGDSVAPGLVHCDRDGFALGVHVSQPTPKCLKGVTCTMGSVASQE